MKVVYKFPIVITDEQDVNIPKGGEFLCVQMQRDVACLWALCDVSPNPERMQETLPEASPTLTTPCLWLTGF